MTVWVIAPRRVLSGLRVPYSRRVSRKREARRVRGGTVYAVLSMALGLGSSACGGAIASSDSNGDAQAESLPGPRSDATLDATDEGMPIDAGASAPPCGTLAPGVPNVATYDAGLTFWACLQDKCRTELAACAADTCCDTAIAMALLCAADASSITGIQNCFITNTGAGGMNATTLDLCLSMHGGDAGCPITITSDASSGVNACELAGGVCECGGCAQCHIDSQLSRSCPQVPATVCSGGWRCFLFDVSDSGTPAREAGADE